MAKGKFLALAESLTGGMVSSEIVAEAGASDFFLGSIVSYQDDAKTGLLGVSQSTMKSQTAVDPEVAIQMAEGARSRFANHCLKNYEDVIAVSTTGVAGPDPVGENPVGLVYFGISSAQASMVVVEHFAGTRAEIRELAAKRALELVREQFTAAIG